MTGQARIRVLIADDSALVRKRLAALLGNLGYVEVVSEAQDTVEAIAGIRRLKPDAVILDIRMPGGGGLSVLERLRQAHTRPMVIVLTDYPFIQYRKKCLELGADFFFDKAAEFYKIPEAFEQFRARAEARRDPAPPDSPEAEAASPTPQPDAATNLSRGGHSSMDAEVKLLRGRYIQKLSDLYNDELELLEALSEMANLAQSPALRRALQQHFGKTKEHVERLDKIFAALAESPASLAGHPGEGPLREYRRSLMDDEALADVDVRLILAARRIERLEISSYLLVLNYAQILRNDTAAALLEETLNEEYEADKVWATLAEAAPAARLVAA